MCLRGQANKVVAKNMTNQLDPQIRQIGLRKRVYCRALCDCFCVQPMHSPLMRCDRRHGSCSLGQNFGYASLVLIMLRYLCARQFRSYILVRTYI